MTTLDTTSTAPAPSERPPTADPRPAPLVMTEVSKWYGHVIGVNDVSLEISPGIVGLLGPNGAGKSTLMKLITGQLRPSIGRVRTFGRSPSSPAARRRVGYCPDVDAFYEEMTGRQFVYAMLRLSGATAAEARERTERTLELVGMADRANTVIRGCSKGMRQRIKLAQAVAHDPDLLILDEPLSGLDPVGRRDFTHLFRTWADQGKTVLVSTHVMEEVESYAESVILIGGGRLLAHGSWAEIAEYRNERPQRIRISSGAARALAGELIRWEGVVSLQFDSEQELIVTTTDAAGLCDAVSKLVCDRGYRLDRLCPDSNWAQTLFGIAREAS